MVILYYVTIPILSKIKERKKTDEAMKLFRNKSFLYTNITNEYECLIFVDRHFASLERIMSGL